MRTPSRLMPKFVRPPTKWWSWPALGLIFAGYGYLLWSNPLPILGITAAGAVLTLVENRRHKHRLRLLATARVGESICTFAKEMDLHGFDTWVVRAVYEQLQGAIAYALPNFPIRWSDRLQEDLGLHGDDLDLDIAMEIAQRTGRSLENTKVNPYYDKVKTVEDLVRFFCSQPKRGRLS